MRRKQISCPPLPSKPHNGVPLQLEDSPISNNTLQDAGNACSRGIMILERRKEFIRHNNSFSLGTGHDSFLISAKEKPRGVQQASNTPPFYSMTVNSLLLEARQSTHSVSTLSTYILLFFLRYEIQVYFSAESSMYRYVCIHLAFTVSSQFIRWGLLN